MRNDIGGKCRSTLFDDPHPPPINYTGAVHGVFTGAQRVETLTVEPPPHLNPLNGQEPSEEPWSSYVQDNQDPPVLQGNGGVEKRVHLLS